MHRDSTPPATFGRPPLLAWAAVLLIAAVALGAVAFTRPAGTQAGYRQEVDLTYSAAGDGAVYDGGRMRTGDPVYLRLVKRMEVQVSYRLMAQDAGRAAGTIGIDARLSGSDGWERTVRVAAPMRFAGTRAGMVAQVDLTAIRSAVRRARERSRADGTFRVDVVPRVSLDAVVDGARRSLRAAPAFGFRMSEDSLVPDTGRSGVRGAAITVATSSAPRTAREISVGAASVGVGTARVVSLGLALGAMLLTGLGLLWRPASRTAEDRAGRRAIEVDDAELMHPAVDVGTMDDLLDVAQRYDRPLMHVSTRNGDTYLVEDRGARYRFGRTALLPIPEPRYVPDSNQAAEPAAPLAQAVAAPQPAPGPEPMSQPMPQPMPGPEPMPFVAELAKAQETFAVDELLARDLVDQYPDQYPDEHPDEHPDAHVQRSVPEIELAPARDPHATDRPHAPRHRQDVDLADAAPAAPHWADQVDWTAQHAALAEHEQPARPATAAHRPERPDPVQAALDAAVTAVPPQRRSAAEAEPRFRIAEPPPGVEQLRSWLRT